MILLRFGEDDELVQRVGETVVSDMAQPIRIAELTLTVSASVGAAVYPAHGTDGISLLRYADQAMYRAKRGGRSRLISA